MQAPLQIPTIVPAVNSIPSDGEDEPLEQVPAWDQLQLTLPLGSTLELEEFLDRLNKEPPLAAPTSGSCRYDTSLTQGPAIHL